MGLASKGHGNAVMDYVAGIGPARLIITFSKMHECKKV